jgi:hypothetical protein
MNLQMKNSLSVHLHHCTSLPFQFFGRVAELRLLDDALASEAVSLVAFVGPGGQGKTAIVQHWLEQLAGGPPREDGVFLWSFYRGKDADACLRQLLADVAGTSVWPEVSASYCVDKLMASLRRGSWVVVLDGLEVVQHESGPWFGRLVHPELGRLLEELASAPSPSVLIVTTRFPLPDLEKRRHARLLSLSNLDRASACGLLRSLGVRGRDEELQLAADSCGRHAKAVELLGTHLAHYHDGAAAEFCTLPELDSSDTADEERHVARVLAAHRSSLSAEASDIVALGTAFREPPTRERLLEYLRSDPVRVLLRQTWGRSYPAFAERPLEWLESLVSFLIELRLLEEVDAGVRGRVLDAHPLVRRGFEHVLGVTGRRQSATARAGFLRGRPDRHRPASLEEAREDIELFHAYCDAGLWDEADRAYLALDKPRYRFVAPALERDLLLRFFPEGDWRRLPLWPRFRHWRALAVCFELLGRFDDALDAYRDEDAPLQGDALLALGRLGPLLHREQAPHPWQQLWRAYRAHALCLAGRVEESIALAASLVPVDVYEWTHVFECLLRAGRLDALDMRSFLYRPATAGGHRWADLARMRMRLDYQRTSAPDAPSLDADYPRLVEEYDRAGLPYERCLTRLGYARCLLRCGRWARADEINAATKHISGRHGMRVVAADALELEAIAAEQRGDRSAARKARAARSQLRDSCKAFGHARP